MPMRQLRSCEFCGGDAAGVYEVLPPELSPTEAEQRRIVLCSDCAETLETVVDPLLERLGAETGAAASGADAGGDDGSIAAEVSEPADPGTAPESDAAGNPSTGGPDPDDGPVQWDDPAGDDGSDGADGSPSDPVRDGIPGIDPSDGDAAETERSGADTDTTDVGDGSGTGTTDDSTRSVGTEDETTRNTGTEDDSARSAEPEEFRTVMRLLGNREFPVERDAIVELAASAYELDEGHVHRIIDHAVDRGVIDDDGGTLRRN